MLYRVVLHYVANVHQRFFPRWPGAGFGMQGYPPTSGYDYNGYKQNSVKEEHITTVLQKGQRGFGFTIVGGDHPEEMLQVKSIVPGGPASVDGKVRVGDALVNVNGMYVSQFQLCRI